MKQKKLFIEGLALVEGHFSGVGHYILGILKGLDDIIDQQVNAGQPKPNIKVVIPYDTVERFRSFNFKHLQYQRVPFSFRVMSALWHRGWMPPLDVFCGKGIYIFTRFVSMPLLFSKSAVLVFDMSYELHKQYSDDRNAHFLSAGVARSIKKAEKVITISHNAKQEIVDFYKVPDSQVSVATPAVEPAYFYRRSPSEIDDVKRKYRIKGDYILALSNLEPRKNLDGLVEAYCQLPKAVRKQVGLLLVGVNGWKTEALFQQIVGKVEQGFNIMRPSHYVTDDDRPAVISGAKVLVYPSHYEGFGMPPLEALACGVPVISADNSSLPEAVGGAATMVKSTDIEGLTKAMADSLEHIDSLTNKALKQGPEQAAKFSWVTSAQVFLDVAKEINQ